MVLEEQLESCGTCRFRRDGECHRNPPFLMIIGQKYDPVWPRVKEHQWCGEYCVADVVDVGHMDIDRHNMPFRLPGRITQEGRT